MRKIYSIFLLGIISISAANSCTTQASSANKKEISVQEATVAKTVPVKQFQDFKDRKEAIILDVRTPDEFKQGHIENAVNIDYYKSNFKTNLDKLDKSKPIYVYCRSGHRSGLTKQLMQQLGFVEVYDLDGGIIAWSKNGLPLIK